MLWAGLVLGLATEGHGRSGTAVQGQLDRGEDVALGAGEVVEVMETLRVRHAGQAIYTEGAATAAEYATIRHGEGSTGILIEGKGVGGLRISGVVLDGNRPGFRQAEGQLEQVPLISLGGEGSDGQSVSRCIVVAARCSGGWAAIHIQEGGTGIRIEDNIVFASGADVRGNGRSLWEKPFGWGDGISTASRDTLIRNNLIYDVTDEGVMVQGGPGTQVARNVIVALSREMLGGIALIDPFKYYQMEPLEAKRFDYRGVLVEDNWIIAMGGRIHAGLPMGGAAWHPFLGGTILHGAMVRNNLISGKACGYGYVANGIDGFTITGNRSDAVYSGKGDGLPGNPPDAPAAFLYNPATVGTSELQEEFRPAQGHVDKVLRSNRVPSDPLGYRDAGYPRREAEAVVEAAYLEMLGRIPDDAELNVWATWLCQTHANADALRSQLMSTPRFIQRFGYVNPLAMQEWRGDRWLKLIIATSSAMQAEDQGRWPDARRLHLRLMQSLAAESN